jgi:hypothetical protein
MAVPNRGQPGEVRNGERRRRSQVAKDFEVSVPGLCGPGPGKLPDGA